MNGLGRRRWLRQGLGMSFRTIEISNPSLAPEGVHFVTVKSAALRRRADITCFVPPGIRASRLPLVTLLHGVYGSHWAWLFKGAAHQVLMRLIEHEGLPPMMLAMPSDGLWGRQRLPASCRRRLRALDCRGGARRRLRGGAELR